MERLPTEIQAMVASHLPDPQSLVNLAMTSKKFYDVVRRDQGGICGNICRNKIGQELPLAIAVLESGRLLETRLTYGQPQQPARDASVEKVMEFVDQYVTNVHPARFQLKYKDCVTLSRFDTIVDTCATTIAEAAREIAPGNTTDMAVTRTETDRFRKSLYIHELLRNVLPRDHVSPAGVARQRAMTDQPVWRYLLTKFAPWELQQVRCAKALLAEQVLKVVMSDAAKQDKKRPYVGSALARRAFVSNEGVVALTVLQGMSEKCATQTSLRHFTRTAQSYATDRWFGEHDSMWLVESGGDTSLDASAVVARYPEEETGPRDAWLHTLLQNDVEDQMFHKSSDLCFTCDFHAAEWGWAFWDRARLDVMTQGTLPTTEQMLSVGRYAQVSTSDLLWFGRFRNERECTCPVAKLGNWSD